MSLHNTTASDFVNSNKKNEHMFLNEQPFTRDRLQERRSLFAEKLEQERLRGREEELDQRERDLKLLQHAIQRERDELDKKVNDFNQSTTRILTTVLALKNDLNAVSSFVEHRTNGTTTVDM